MTYRTPPSVRFHDLHNFQFHHGWWLAHNFPNQLQHDALLGVIEEVGELAHAHLKRDQGIRGYTEERYRQEALDAVGDIIIYLASYCNTNGLSLAGALEKAWDEVRERDWVKYPGTGKPEAEVREGSDQKGPNYSSRLAGEVQAQSSDSHKD